MRLINNDCIEAMKEMDDNSVDSIVTDPPYELGFMGKSWDASGIAFNIEVWQQALRVLKPGGHLIAFSGSRTYHRMAVAIEDAGFEIRDQIMWVYGSGFPKSLNISKAIDKTNGEPNRLLKFTTWMRTTGLKAKQLDEVTGTNMGGHYLTTASQPAIPTVELWGKIRPLIADVPEWVDELVDRIEAEREVIGTRITGAAMSGKVSGLENGQGGTDFGSGQNEVPITAPATAEAKQWDGWGTALKPAHEPMVLARKPVEGTVANNVLTYGVGGLNIDATRVEGEVPSVPQWSRSDSNAPFDALGRNGEMSQPHSAGRFPANFIHDGSDEVVALFPSTSPSPRGLITQGGKAGGGFDVGSSDGTRNTKFQGHGDSGSAARFFYCAKASKRDRNEGLDDSYAKQVDETRKVGSKGGNNPRNRGANERINHHPTVKPTSLMQYLVRLVTPEGGLVLDPFMGSGSTGKACAYEGFDFIGIDQSAEYVEIARARIAFAQADDE
jgi:DNA modification methylase